MLNKEFLYIFFILHPVRKRMYKAKCMYESRDKNSYIFIVPFEKVSTTKQKVEVTCVWSFRCSERKYTIKINWTFLLPDISYLSTKGKKLLFYGIYKFSCIFLWKLLRFLLSYILLWRYKINTSDIYPTKTLFWTLSKSYKSMYIVYNQRCAVTFVFLLNFRSFCTFSLRDSFMFFSCFTCVHLTWCMAVSHTH